MKYESVAQFTVNGGCKVDGTINLLERYGIDFVVLNSSGTGLFSTRSCEIAILKPEPSKMTPDRLLSFMMKFDEMVRIGKETHALTPAQIDLAKSCDKAKMLKLLDEIWYYTKVAYTRVVAMLAQAYAIVDSRPDSKPGDENNSGDTKSLATNDAMKAFLDSISDEDKEQLMGAIYNVTKTEPVVEEFLKHLDPEIAILLNVHSCDCSCFKTETDDGKSGNDADDNKEDKT